MTRTMLGGFLVICGVSLLAACGPPAAFETQPGSNNSDNSSNNSDPNNSDPNNSSNNNSDPNNSTEPEEDMGGPVDMDGPGDTGGPGEPMLVFEPDLEAFDANLMPWLRGCGAPGLCHASTSSARVFKLETDDPLSEEQLVANVDAFMEWADYESPVDSQILAYMVNRDNIHQGFSNLLEGSGEYESVISWLEGSTRLVEPDPPDMGGDMPDMPEEDMPEPDMEEPAPEVPCDSFPSRETIDNLPGGLSYDDFRDHINPLLVQRCSGGSICHGNQGVGGGLWYLRDTEDECHVTWNYLTNRWFIDFQSSGVSPLLVVPLGQQVNDVHTGDNSFRSTSDCGYVATKFWIEGSPPPPCP